MHATAERLGVPTAIHVAESAAEVQLLLDGTGPLAGTAARTAHGFTPPGTSTAAYLAALGALDRATAVHLCHATEADVALLARHACGAVTCPRSNYYLDNPPPRVTPLLEARIPVGVGTDSSASNYDLDLFAEVRALHAAEPHLGSEMLIRIATAGGAEAIGVADRYGTLEAGKFADIALFAVGAAEDPQTALVERGRRRQPASRHERRRVACPRRPPPGHRQGGRAARHACSGAVYRRARRRVAGRSARSACS